MAQSSKTNSCCSIEPCLAYSSTSSLPWRPQWSSTQKTSTFHRTTATCTSLLSLSGDCGLPTISTSDLQWHVRGTLRQYRTLLQSRALIAVFARKEQDLHRNPHIGNPVPCIHACVGKQLLQISPFRSSLIGRQVVKEACDRAFAHWKYSP